MPPAKIDHFRGDYYFLSNFYSQKIPLLVPNPEDSESLVPVKTVEHGYQMSKCVLAGDAKHIMLADSPGEAKRRGKRVMLRDDWEQVKIPIMRELLRQKFFKGELRFALLDTGDAELVEGNWWGDRFWGVCNGEGENWLGKLLMQIREEVR